jgi:FHA domain-containing protein
VIDGGGTSIQNAYLEVFGPSGPSIVALESQRVALGSAETNDVPVPWDGTVSKLHAVIERYPSGWCVRDVGSRNGTYLNGERIAGEHVLRPGDEIRAGETRILFRISTPAVAATATAAVQGPPELTRRERDVLIALCRPVLSRNLYTDPATIRAMAAELVISESAVKKHLGRLYDKFEIHEPDERRRGRLVGEAIRRGAVGLSDAKD